MATERISMRKTREILRQKWLLGATHRGTARSLQTSVGVIGNTLTRAKLAGLKDWTEVTGLTEDELEGLLYRSPAAGSHPREEPDCEWIHRERRRKGVTLQLLHDEYLGQHPSIEDVDCSSKREIERSLIKQLATGRWIAEHINVLITGATGVGKTYLACALGQLACRKGFRVLYKRMPRLLEELALAHADGTYMRTLQRIAKVDVLDDWGLAPLSDPQRRDILEIARDRYASRSTIITSQLPVEKWHDHLGDPTIADAVLDRVVHHAHRFNLKGPSGRKKEMSNS